ncbi:hypothetical protein [Thalassomonas actiniarum]|uniref:Uncharacterized protein n=1 Tax=Thalassomonas actiniarum TaxID=485447 RepID=A0AAE9YZD6_9GAMM|nr:hypothetical protein [Thalassomonas actiniarum]WDE02417.1 hypothetical protein SG35_028815 [Thalassomonas actiniarum]
MQKTQSQWKIADSLFIGCEQQDDRGKPSFIILAGDKAYLQGAQLLQDYPCLTKAETAEITAKIVLFLHRGEHDSVVVDADEFQKSYQSRLLQEQLDETLAPLYRQHPEFDINRVHPPQWQSNRLSFFFVEHNTGLPYYVSYDYPAAGMEQSLFLSGPEHDPGFECRLLASL